jgi:dTDP-4-amino-4,6-dideoxygalactose transaminase
MQIEYENLAKSNQIYHEQFKKAFDNVLQSGWFILGEQVKQFETEF